LSTIGKEDKRAVAKNRSDIYGLLAALYRQEVTSDFLQQIKDPQFLGVLADLGFDVKREFLLKPEKELLEVLAVEYTRLFLGPGKHISPHESVHHQRDDGQWGNLWGKSTAEVKKFIESTGLGYVNEYKGLPDHISVELEFMQHLTLHEKKAWEEDSDKAVAYQEVEKKFVEAHLIQWIPSFCEKVIEHAELSFYRAMAALTRSFIKFEMEELKINGDGAK
jgi:TorA maturation chaperone TorD